MTTICYVDPHNPQEAILVRWLRPGLLSGACLLGISLLLLWMTILLIRQDDRDATARFLQHWRVWTCGGILVLGALIMGQVLSP
jgi:hypothetical protein